MELALIAIVAGLVTVGIALLLWRLLDLRHDARVWNALAPSGKDPIRHFDPSMVEGLPEPAQRYFLYTIKPGAELFTAAEISMRGKIGLGTKDRPGYLPMRAHQMLAPPIGFVWKLSAGKGLARISGSDGLNVTHSWSRFWLMEVLPVARAGEGTDHARAAFGRLVAEATFWAPAALLPGEHVKWEAAGENIARATVAYNGLAQDVDITVTQDGRPAKIVMSRWSNANPDKTYRLQPFGGYVSKFKEFNGYMLPTHVEGGNFIGTQDYFPFFKADVETVRFLAP